MSKIKKKDTLGINENVKGIRQNSKYLSSPLKHKEKHAVARIDAEGLDFCDFRERRSSFSLNLRPFGPSVLDGARSKVDQRGEGYAWTPIWWSSDNSKR